MNRKQFGQLLAEARKNKNLSQPKIADRAGTTAQRISQIELGKNNVTLDGLLAICSALNVSINLVPATAEDYNDL